MRPKSPVFLFMVLLSFSALSDVSPVCLKAFEKSRIDPKSRNCFQECAIHNWRAYLCNDECYELCSPPVKIWLYFGNGMFNTREDAQASLNILRRKLYPFLLDKYPHTTRFLVPPIQTRIAYNHDEFVSDQLLQVLEQWSQERVSNFFRYLSGLEAMPEELKTIVKKRRQRPIVMEPSATIVI